MKFKQCLLREEHTEQNSRILMRSPPWDLFPEKRCQDCIVNVLMMWPHALKVILIES